MKRTKLLMENPPQSVPRKGTKDVMVKSQILELDGKEILNMDLFYAGKCQGRYFADHENHYFYIDGKWKNCNLRNAARLSKGKEAAKSEYYYVRNEWEWASKEDGETALDYLDTYSVDSYENKISCKKQRMAVERKCERIHKMMEWIPPVPEEAKTWLKEEIFPGDILFFTKKETRTNYSCTACGKSGWKKKAWKHGKQTACPKCGKEVMTNCRQSERMKKAPVVILQGEKGKWVERQFIAQCRWSRKGKEIELYEQCRAIIPEGQCWGKVYYGSYRQADEFNQVFWDKNQENKRFMESYLYPGNLQETLPYGKLEKSGLDLIAAEKRKANVNKFITTYHQRPYIEYLNKAGLTRLAVDIINSYGWYGDPKIMRLGEQKLKDVLKLDGNRTYRMKQLNGTLVTLDWLQYEQKHDIRITQETLEYLTEKKVHVEDCREILEELKSVNRMANYMKKQKTQPGRLVSIWKDYLRMAAEEGMDTNDDIIRLPKDIKARHDTLVGIRNARLDKERMEKEKEKYAALDAGIKRKLPEAARYFWEDEEYMIIPAGKCEELIIEGRALHHCVGASDSYMKKMAEGKTWICFLRRKSELEKPYYTLEISMENDRIIQWYSEFDRKPNKEEVGKVLEKFKRQIKQKKVRAMARTA